MEFRLSGGHGNRNQNIISRKHMVTRSVLTSDSREVRYLEMDSGLCTVNTLTKAQKS